MGWIAIGAWIFAALATLVILGFCGYEIGWKAKRLQQNLAAVQADAERLDSLRGAMAQVQTQIAAMGPSAARDASSGDSSGGR